MQSFSRRSKLSTKRLAWPWRLITCLRWSSWCMDCMPSVVLGLDGIRRGTLHPQHTLCMSPVLQIRQSSTSVFSAIEPPFPRARIAHGYSSTFRCHLILERDDASFGHAYIHFCSNNRTGWQLVDALLLRAWRKCSYLPNGDWNCEKLTYRSM